MSAFNTFHPDQSSFGKLQVTRFIMIETGTYGKQHRRPFAADTTGDALAFLNERVDFTREITPNALASSIGHILLPVADPEAFVSINRDTGWDERRFRFMMEVSEPHAFGDRKYVYMGYTSHYGIANSMALDPSMEFYINSVVKVDESVRYTPHGKVATARMSEASHVLANNDWTGIQDANSSLQFKMRPTDLVLAMGSSHLPEGTFSHSYNSVPSTLNAGVSLRSLPQKTSRRNNSPVHYGANLLESWRQVITTSDPDECSSESIYVDVRAKLEEPTSVGDPLMAAIGRTRGSAISSMFSLSELYSIDPNVVHILRETPPFVLDTRSLQKVHHNGQSSDWGASTLEAQMAAFAAQVFPSIMMDCGVVKASANITNECSINLEPIVLISDVDSFSSADHSALMEIMRNRVMAEIVPTVSHNNGHRFVLDIECELMAETKIHIAYEGQEIEYYNMPSFADALLSPQITSFQQHVMALANDIESICANMHNPQEYVPAASSSRPGYSTRL